METTKITVEAMVKAPVEKVWEFWSGPEHITKWNSASEDWHTPSASNDLRTGGKFNSRMESRDGKTGFDFEGIYDEVKTQESIAYTMSDGRKVNVLFTVKGDQTHVKETFDAEHTHTHEMQREGWQSILDNFKKYAEGEG